MADINKIDNPVNATEQYLYGINVRLEVLIEMFSSFLAVYAKDNQIAVEKHIKNDPIITETKPKTKKGTKKAGV